jgi:SOS-response transcriptional repressor LexA
MKMGLTIKQEHMKGVIADFITENKYSPTYKQLAELSGIKNISNVHRIVHELRRRGHIELLPGQERSIAIKD